MQNIQTKEKVISQAIARYLRVSPFKVRRVVKAVKGQSVTDALNVLRLLQHHTSARYLYKVIESAAANAKNNAAFSGELKVENILVDQALIMKRFQPRSRGRAFPIKKRLSHIAVFLTEHKR